MIYYPHYTPSKKHLRAILLFSDEISLIVPAVDQSGVRQRSHLTEILDEASWRVNFLDPTHNYTKWLSRRGVRESTENLILDVMQKIEDEPDFEEVSVDRRGRPDRNQDEAISWRHKKYGWKYIAAQKFPIGLRDLIFESGVAINVGAFRDSDTGSIIEHNGILCHPEIADFVIARMAREASLNEGLPSITFGGVEHSNHLYDQSRPIRGSRHLLLQSVIDIFIPDHLERMSVNDFESIRQEYSNIRREINSYLQDVTMENFLDSEYSKAKTMLKRVKKARRRVSEEFKYTMSQIGKKRFREGCSVAVDASTSVFATAATHGADQLVSMAGEGAKFLGSKLSSRVSTLREEPDGRLKSVAMTKAR